VPVNGALVAFSSVLGAVSPVSATTDAAGIVAATFSAGATPGQAVVHAACEGLTQSITLQLETPQLSALDLQAGAASIAVGAQTTITVSVRDQFERPLSGELVSLFSSLGTVSPSSGFSDDYGQVNAVFSANGAPGEATITALAGGVSDTIRIQILAAEYASSLYLPIVVRGH
jgi:hypothetical protein